MKYLPGIDAPLRPADIIDTLIAPLSLPIQAANAARIISERCQEHVEGRTPMTVSGGCLMLACELLHIPIRLEDLAIVSNVAESTLSGFCRAMKKDVGVLLNSSELQKYKLVV